VQYSLSHNKNIREVIGNVYRVRLKLRAVNGILVGLCLVNHGGCEA
jgi:hypothetical protein